jgi:DNA-binding PadR family transcriptional regulator
MILLAVLQRKDDAYGVTIHEELTRHTTRPVARGAVYMTLDRLEKKGFLKSTLTEATAERGGRFADSSMGMAWCPPPSGRRSD